MVVPSLVGLCVLAVAPYADEVHKVPWTRLRWRELGIELDVDAWTVIIRLFADVPRPLCSFLTSVRPVCTHGYLTVLSLPDARLLTPALLADTPRLAALDASSTALDAVPPSLVHLRVLYLRNCRRITDHGLPALLALPLLSVIDLSGTRCTSAAAVSPFAPSTRTDLFPPSIEASLAALADEYDTLPSPLYTLTHVLPRPPKPVRRKGAQDSFVVFSSSSTKIGNTNTLVFREEHPDHTPKRLSAIPPPVFDPPRLSHLHLHRPPPPVPPLYQPTTHKPRPSQTTSASLNLQNHKALLARNGIDAFIKLRSTPSTPLPPSPAPTPSSSKNNPFKKPISSFTPPVLPPNKKLKFTSFDWKAWSSSS